MYETRVDAKIPYELKPKATHYSPADIADELVNDDLIDYDAYMDIKDAFDDEDAWLVLRDTLEEQGFDGISYMNMVEDAGSEVLIPLRPQQVRFNSAKFDPRKADSANPAAAVAGAAVVGAAASGEAEAKEDFSDLNAFLAPQQDFSDLNALLSSSDRPELSSLDVVRGMNANLMHGVLAGGDDEVAGFGRSLIDYGIAGLLNEDEYLLEGQETQSFMDRWKMYRDDQEAIREEYARQNPMTAMALEIGGALMLPSVGGLKALSFIDDAALATRIGTAMGIAGAEGALYGAMHQNDDRTKGAVEGAVWGLAGGAVLGTGMAANAARKRIATRLRGRNKLADEDIARAMEEETLLALDEGLGMDEAVKAAARNIGVKNEDAVESILNTQLFPNIPATAEGVAERARIIRSARNPANVIERNGVAKFADNLVGAIHTRLRKVSAPLAGLYQRMEYNTLKEIQTFHNGIQGLTSLRRLRTPEFRTVKSLLRNRGTKDAIEYLETLGGGHAAKASEALRNWQGISAELSPRLKAYGMDFDEIEGYFPSMVTNYNKMRGALNKQQQGTLDRAVERLRSVKGRPVSRLERERLINAVLSGRKPVFHEGTGKMSFSKGRTVEYVPDSLLDLYSDPLDAAEAYIRKAVQTLNEAKFFDNAANSFKGTPGSLRKRLERMRKAGIDTADLDLETEMSVGALVEDLREAGVSPVQLDEITDALTARFVGGRKQKWAITRVAGDLGRMAALGNPVSAALQFADVGQAMWLHGMGNTIAAMIEQVARKVGRKPYRIDTKDVGLEHIVTTEMNNAGKTARWLDKSLKWSAFKAIDRFGKRTHMLAAWKRAQAAERKDPKAFREKFIDEMGEDIDGLIGNLRSDVLDDDVSGLFMFNRLSDTQPVTMGSMPTAWLNHPNGRILYALRSFTIRQLDLLRNRVGGLWAEGKHGEAALSAAHYALIVGMLTGTVDEARNMMVGDEFNVEDIPANAFWQLVSLSMVVNKYNASKMTEGTSPYDVVVNSIAPPVGWVESVPHDLVDPPESLAGSRALKDFPIIGKIIYNWFGGGKEKRERYND
jgi:hypothetical protein